MHKLEKRATFWIPLRIGLAALLFAAFASATSARAEVVLNADEALQKFSVHVKDASRAEVLAELMRVVGIEIRPLPDPEARLTLDADGLELDQLLAKLLPADGPFVVRRGEQEIGSKLLRRPQPKKGAAVAPDPALRAKSPDDRRIVKEGVLKPRADLDLQLPVLPAGPRVKELPDKLQSEERFPKQPLLAQAVRTSLRVTLVFEQGAAPRVQSVQVIEGGSPDKLVRGPFFFTVLGPQGELLQSGSFEDPLEEHSYLPEGPHSSGRAKSGIAGISIANEKLDGARLRILDARELRPEGELSGEMVRGALERGKVALEVPMSQLLRLAKPRR